MGKGRQPYIIDERTGVSEAKRNYSIPPMSIAKITKNTDAQIIGPFRKIPGSFDPSQEH
jgi:hypothetical protein